MRLWLGVLAALLRALLNSARGKRSAKRADAPPQAGPLGIYRPPVDDTSESDEVPF